MKNLSIIIVFVLTFSITACGQNEKVPAKVKTAFEQKFTKAKRLSFSKENEKEWEAEFKMNRKEYSANFDLDGNWLETEYEISEKEIPGIIKETIESQFAGYNISESEISETADGKVYEFELMKGESGFEVSIDIEGNILKKEILKDNDDKD